MLVGALTVSFDCQTCQLRFFPLLSYRRVFIILSKYFVLPLTVRGSNYIMTSIMSCVSENGGKIHDPYSSSTKVTITETWVGVKIVLYSDFWFYVDTIFNVSE